MFRDVSSCNTYNYGDALYWDSRYLQEAGSFDWYQRYPALRPFVRKFITTSSSILMVGCGNAVMSEDMVKDGYEDITNIDISSVAIDMMRRKYEFIPQLKYMQMDVRDMSFFPDEKFGAVIDKGTLDSLMCGTDAPISAAQMLGEVSRLLKPGGIYLLITYGDPKVRMPHLMRPSYNWKIVLYIILFARGLVSVYQTRFYEEKQSKFETILTADLPNLIPAEGLLRTWYAFEECAFATVHNAQVASQAARPGFLRPEGCSSSEKSYLEPVPLTDNGLISPNLVMEDPDSHFIYVCRKMDESNLSNIPPYQLTADDL